MEAIGISMAVVPGERLIDSPWINSDLENSIDENTELNLKDDFHIAINRDWLLDNTAVGDEYLSTWDVIQATMNENKYSLLYRNKELNPDPNVMSKETLTHIQELIWDMIDLASDQEKRNELSLNPLVSYLEDIENIDSMEEMTQSYHLSDKIRQIPSDLQYVSFKRLKFLMM